MQELERQEDPRQGSPSHTTAAVRSTATADTVTQGSSGGASASALMTDLDAGRRRSHQVMLLCIKPAQSDASSRLLIICML